MTTVYSAWQGSGAQARIRLDYAVTYSADRTQAIYNGTFYIEFGGSISDATNSWAISGDCGSASGSNISYSVPTGGAARAFKTMPQFQQYGNGVVAGSVTGIDAIGGGQILGTFTLASGGLAPYWSPSDYTAIAVTQTGFTIGNLHANGNGGTLNNVQLEYSGGGTNTPGAFQNIVATGLNPNTTYTYRLRCANSTYGWGAWGPWKTVTTLSTVPGPATDAWYIGSITQNSANVEGMWLTNDGGAAIDQVLVRVSPNSDMSGYWDLPGGWETRVITGLTPGTTYYVWIYLHNANGYSAPSGPKAFTTAPGVYVNVGGVWKNAVPYINVNGVWKNAIGLVNVGGTWKQ